MLKKLPLIACLVCLSACISAPPDFLACANLGESGYCRTYTSHKLITIDNDKNLYQSTGSKKKLKWKDVVTSAVLIPADQFVSLKNFFDNYCHENGCPDGIGDWQHFADDLGKHIKGD